MESFHNHYHGIEFCILNRKENKEAGTISFEVRIPWKNPENSYGKIPSKIDGSDVRKWALGPCSHENPEEHANCPRST